MGLVQVEKDTAKSIEGNKSAIRGKGLLASFGIEIGLWRKWLDERRWKRKR